MQANETIKLVTGIGKPLINCLLTYNALNNHLYEVELFVRQDTSSLVPKNKDYFRETDYNWLCGSTEEQYEIDYRFFDDLLATGNIDVIDVREPDEIPAIGEFAHHQIPLNQLMENLSLIKSNTVIIFCQSGKRSLQAAKQLTTVFGTSKKIFSLRRGIIQWKQHHTKQLL